MASHHDEPHVNGRFNKSSTKHVGHLRMNKYACWITFNGVMLMHNHWN